ncbi:tyrosine-type recombinase/integrase [Luteimonas sp. A478]
MAKFPFDDRSIRALPAPAKGVRIDYDDGPVRGLAIQTSYTGDQRFLMVYVAKASGRERRMVIGEYGRAPKLSVSAARRLAAEKRALVDLGRDPWQEARDARAEAEKQASRTAATFGGLMAAYVEHLKGGGKASWPEVERAIERHITPRKALAATPADQITIDAVMPVFHGLTRQGKLREAEKLRAYMRAAYTAARKARTDASMHAFEGFSITTHPLLDLSVSRPKEAADKAAVAARERKWAFSEAQLAAYWRRLKADTSPAGALLRFHLLTGGQRVEQLSRLTVHDYDPDARTITLRDTKGRRRTVYEHVVPLLPEAVKALEAMRTDEPAGPHLFTLTAGATPAAYHSVWEATQAVAEAMVEAEELPRLFTPGTIRKTVETRLAAKGVSREIRGRLLSHGLGGVQDTHYDDHTYMTEKLATLEKLRALLMPKGRVIKFPATAGSKR